MFSLSQFIMICSMAHATLVKMDITFVHSYHNVLQNSKVWHVVTYLYIKTCVCWFGWDNVVTLPNYGPASLLVSIGKPSMGWFACLLFHNFRLMEKKLLNLEWFLSLEIQLTRI